MSHSKPPSGLIWGDGYPTLAEGYPASGGGHPYAEAAAGFDSEEEGVDGWGRRGAWQPGNPVEEDMLEVY